MMVVRQSRTHAGKPGVDMAGEFPIVFALYPRVTQLDFTAPLEVFARLPGAAIVLAAVRGGELAVDSGVTFANVRPLAEVQECALLCVPGGGVTAGIDMALTVMAEIAGQDLAEAVQLAIEYSPDPPFDCGRPEAARAEILAAVRRRFDAGWPGRLAAAQRASAALPGAAAPAH